MEQMIDHCSQQIQPEYKSLWQKNTFRIVSTITLSIAAIAITAFFLRRAEDPQNSFLLDKADPDKVMATNIRSFHDITNLKEINGVAISKIESRARPGKWASSGFLGKEESLLNVLQKDWKTVNALGTTHIELADHLKSIWDIALENFQNSREPESLIAYNFSKLKDNTINKHHKIKLFNGYMGITCGMQGDIFFNGTVLNENGFGWPGEAWGSHLVLKNPKNNEAIILGEGVINYIRKYGFYEGGENNPYRIDPIRLASVFTGHSYCSIASAIKQPCN